jgi:molybdenum cofactor cytidylyltransferase
MKDNTHEVAAIVLAAGLSQRMGNPKMTLPWKGSTVLGSVIDTIHASGIKEITVVTGGSRELVEAIVDDMRFFVAKCFNQNFSNGEMLDSIKTGLSSLGSDSCAAMIALGDQPQVETLVVATLVEKYSQTGKKIIVPSFHNRRGHPWLISRKYWEEILGMKTGQTMRDFFALHRDDIEYLVVDTPSVLQDLDTPEDYLRAIR